MNSDSKQDLLFVAFDLWEVPKEETRMCTKQQTHKIINNIYVCFLTLGGQCGSEGWKSSTSLQFRSGWARGRDGLVL